MSKVDECLDKLADGATLVEVCAELEIPRKSFYEALDESEGLAHRYARARERQQDSRADRIVVLVRTPYPVDDKGRVDTGAVQARRLEIETEKWLMSKLNRTYSDKVDITTDGKPLPSPIALLPPELLLPVEPAE